MATLNATKGMVHITRADAVSGVHEAQVLFTATGAYDQSATAPIEILLVKGAIEDSLRNGKTVTLLDATTGPSGLIGGVEYYTANTVINTAAVECDLYQLIAGTEHAGAALGTFTRPCSVIVSFKES